MQHTRRFNLIGPRERMYLFEVFPDGWTRVARYEGNVKKRDELKSKKEARGLWRFLEQKHGYKRV